MKLVCLQLSKTNTFFQFWCFTQCPNFPTTVSVSNNTWYHVDLNFQKSLCIWILFDTNEGIKYFWNWLYWTCLRPFLKGHWTGAQRCALLYTSTDIWKALIRCSVIEPHLDINRSDEFNKVISEMVKNNMCNLEVTHLQESNIVLSQMFKILTYVMFHIHTYPLKGSVRRSNIKPVWSSKAVLFAGGSLARLKKPEVFLKDNKYKDRIS